jgi:hypothetical protein
MVAVAAISVCLLFLWQKPTEPAGALLDLVVQFYRPALWVVLAVLAVVLLTPALVWAWKRATRSRPD